MLPHMRASPAGPHEARNGITQRPVLLLCTTEVTMSRPRLASHTASVLSRDVVSTCSEPASTCNYTTCVPQVVVLMQLLPSCRPYVCLSALHGLTMAF